MVRKNTERKLNNLDFVLMLMLKVVKKNIPINIPNGFGLVKVDWILDPVIKIYSPSPKIETKNAMINTVFTILSRLSSDNLVIKTYINKQTLNWTDSITVLIGYIDQAILKLLHNKKTKRARAILFILTTLSSKDMSNIKTTDKIIAVYIDMSLSNPTSNIIFKEIVKNMTNHIFALIFAVVIWFVIYPPLKPFNYLC